MFPALTLHGTVTLDVLKSSDWEYYYPTAKNGTVTLDVLKLIKRWFYFCYFTDGTVTLDVLKLIKALKSGKISTWNRNIGCIEMCISCYSYLRLTSWNRNIGCIEILMYLFAIHLLQVWNRNIGCIEIHNAEDDAVTAASNGTVTLDVLKFFAEYAWIGSRNDGTVTLDVLKFNYYSSFCP